MKLLSIFTWNVILINLITNDFYYLLLCFLFYYLLLIVSYFYYLLLIVSYLLFVNMYQIILNSLLIHYSNSVGPNTLWAPIDLGPNILWAPIDMGPSC